MSDQSQVPSSIVSLLIDKLSSFTKEIEVLRAQLPSKEDINKLHGKIDRFLNTVKVLFSVIMLIVVLSFLGAKFLEHLDQKSNVKQMTNTVYTKEEMDKKFKLLFDEVKKLHGDKPVANPFEGE